MEVCRRTKTYGLSRGERFLFNLNKSLNKYKIRGISREVIEELGEYGRRISELRRIERMGGKGLSEGEYGTGYTGSPIMEVDEGDLGYDSSLRVNMVGGGGGMGTGAMQSTNKEKYTHNIQSHSKHPHNDIIQLPIKPYFLKLSKEVFSPYCIAECLYDYLQLQEIIIYRSISKPFFHASAIYFPIRLQSLSDAINSLIQSKKSLNFEYLKLINTQIPISRENWLSEDIEEVLYLLTTSVKKQVITEIRSLKQIPLAWDMALAPFCILYGVLPIKYISADGSNTQRWAPSAIKIMSASGFISSHTFFAKDTIPEDAIYEAFEYLNTPQLNIHKVAKFSIAISHLVQWARALVSYHFITRPYKIRNPQGIYIYIYIYLCST